MQKSGLACRTHCSHGGPNSPVGFGGQPVPGGRRRVGWQHTYEAADTPAWSKQRMATLLAGGGCTSGQSGIEEAGGCSVMLAEPGATAIRVQAGSKKACNAQQQALHPVIAHRM